MMQHLKYFIIPLTLITILTTISCEKEIPFSGEAINPRLIIHAYISSNDSTYIHAGKSASISDPEENSNIENATINIFDGSLIVGTYVHDTAGFYKPKIPVTFSAEKNYKLVASAPNLPTVESYQTIPSPIDFSVTAHTKSQGDTIHKDVIFDIKFTDNVATKNFYSIKIFYFDTIFEDSVHYQIEPYRLYGTTSDLAVEKISTTEVGGEGTNYTDVFLLSDHLFNGKTHSLSIKESRSYSEGKRTFFVEFNVISEAYFNHSLTKEKYWIAHEDPFSQPVQIYSNIENGLGIFAGYQFIRKEIKIQ